MSVFTAWLGKQGIKAAGWIGLNVLLPWLQKKAAILIAKMKAQKEHDQAVKEATVKNEAYENNPSDDTFGNSN